MLVGAVVWGYRMRPTDKPCSSIQFIIQDKAERQYVTEKELLQVLEEEGLNPVGRPMDIGVLHRMEQLILHHPMVRTAECYMTPRNEVRVRLTQRVPILRVQMPGDTYFIDSDRKVMPVRAAVKDSVLVVTGMVGVQLASGVLADFAQWLEDEPYWQERIHHVYVHTPQMMYLYLKKGERFTVSGERIVLGTMRGYERKLNKLRTFFENSEEIIRDKNYYEYDIRFRGQVIGRY